MPVRTAQRGRLIERADRTRAVTDVDTLTPVDDVGGIFYKRDDLFMPYPDIDLSGGKVRQAIELLARRRDGIVRDDGGLVLTATSVHSPQGLIIARVARSFGLRCRLFVGATTAAGALSHPLMQASVAQGAELDASTRIGYEPALMRTVEAYRARYRCGFLVRFGMNLETDPDALIGSTAAQCRNIPAAVTTLVVPVGAGITAGGILLGVAMHCPHVTRVVCIQIAGYDRRPLLARLAPGRTFEWHASRRWPYAKELRRAVAPGFGLDPIYEAKAHALMQGIGVPRGATCFWVVGDSRFVR